MCPAPSSLISFILIIPSPCYPSLQELVQVQTLAQLGVSLLLFGLGMELSPARLRATWGVAVVGGTLQVNSDLKLKYESDHVLCVRRAHGGGNVAGEKCSASLGCWGHA